jgi:hypothetical protein
MSASLNEQRYLCIAKTGSALTLAASDAEIGRLAGVVGRGARAGECCARARG